MKLNLSVFFNSDRIYLALVERQANGLNLKYVNSTSKPLDLENPDDPASLEAVKELETILLDMDFEIDRLSVTLPADSALISQFPGQEGLADEDIWKLVNLEVKQLFPHFDKKEFSSSVIPLAPRIDGSLYMLAAILPKQIYENCKKALNSLNVVVDNIEISQFNTHSAFLFNYPEQVESTVAFFGIQDKFLDVSVIKNKQPVYYNLAKLENINDLGRICSIELEKVTANFVEYIQSAYFFGKGLTLDSLDQAQKEISDQVMASGRLNPFRMMSTSLNERDLQYCQRTAHVFAPCLGAALPAYHDKIKLI